MRNFFVRTGAVALAIFIAGCATNQDTNTMTTEPELTDTMATTAETNETTTRPDNPLLAEWDGAYGGVPPFDEVRVEHFEPALEAAMAENLANVEKIANDPAPPTFENTIAALERASRTLDRVGTDR